MATLKEHTQRMNQILNGGFVERHHLAEVALMLNDFSRKNWHRRYGNDREVSEKIRVVYVRFRNLRKVTTAGGVAPTVMAKALQAVGELDKFIALDGDSIVCRGWELCEQRYRYESKQGNS